MKKFMASIATIFALFFFVSCGGSNEEKTDEQTDTDEISDSEENDAETLDVEVVDEEPDEPELAYPEVTATSNKEGDIAQNIIIYDDLDNEHQLAEWYKPNNPSSKLIWLIFTTYDCPPCKILKEDLLEINLREYREQGLKIILVFNGSYIDGPQVDREPERLAEYKDIYLSEYPDTGRFELYGYLRDQKIFKKFISGFTVGYPTWAFIDASNMEIVEWGEGWGDNMVNSTKSKIEILLEEL